MATGSTKLGKAKWDKKSNRNAGLGAVNLPVGPFFERMKATNRKSRIG